MEIQKREGDIEEGIRRILYPSVLIFNTLRMNRQVKFLSSGYAQMIFKSNEKLMKTRFYEQKVRCNAHKHSKAESQCVEKSICFCCEYFSLENMPNVNKSKVYIKFICIL
jgi:hypothetical protein